MTGRLITVATSAAVLCGAVVFGLTLRNRNSDDESTQAFIVPAGDEFPVEAAQYEAPAQPPVKAAASGLPLPSTLSVSDYEAELFPFLNNREYVELGWARDKGVRDTGPFLNGKEYGTHPAVRIFYSPEMMEWLQNERQGEIPDGAMMVKEQFHAPAIRHAGKSEDELWDSLKSWTIMVKDSRGSHDGWFWSNPGKGHDPVDYYTRPFEEPYSGFGIYCVRCHASAKSSGKTNEYTFASLRNIEGFPGEPLLFRVDDSWRPPEQRGLPPEPPHDTSNEEKLASILEDDAPKTDSHPRCTKSDYPAPCETQLNEVFVDTFAMKKTDHAKMLHIPPVTYDYVARMSKKVDPQQQYITSNQCMSCHAGLLEPFGPTMFLTTTAAKHYTAPGVNYSPYGEWRWTPMGLAGRDPIFFAQLESELANLDNHFDRETATKVGEQLQKTCLSCHGVMGKRQHDIDHASDSSAEEFSIAHVYNHTTDPSNPHFGDAKYGALARDGISCVVCHRAQPRQQPAGDTRPYLKYFLETSITGNFALGKSDEIYGPYKDDKVSPYIMDHAVGFRPKHSDYIKSSQMCGSCHTVNLPMIGIPAGDESHHHGHGHSEELIAAEPNPLFKKFEHHVEQATYLEWLNSDYDNELRPSNPNGRSCQDCHMSRGIDDAELGIDIKELQSRIAIVQDDSYPDAENLASHKELKVRVRDKFSRHNFRGLNVFLLEMFNQFDDILGVRKVDYMTGSKTDIEFAKRDFVRQANQDTADIKLTTRWNAAGELIADVDVISKVGHRFPSGVGFRRAFLEFLVIDESQPEDKQLVWSSGRTNAAGVIIDHEGNPLATEFFDPDPKTGEPQYQPHHTEITDSTQVQIYETLLQNEGKFTTSFIHCDCTIKDNRLLPRGWSKTGPDPKSLSGAFLAATMPGDRASKDPRYQDGSGSDVTTYRIRLPKNVDRTKLKVRATLCYQAIPPYFLKNIFELSPNGPATQRLFHLCSNLKLEGTPIEGWRLQLKVVERQLSSPNSAVSP